jgi:hypothetical protein
MSQAAATASVARDSCRSGAPEPVLVSVVQGCVLKGVWGVLLK